MKAIKYAKIAFIAVAGVAIIFTSTMAIADVIMSMSDTSTSTSVSEEVIDE